MNSEDRAASGIATPRENPAPLPWWARARAGDALSAAAGLSFLLTCLLLPLVGKAGAATPYAAQNRRTFASALAATFALALAATFSKWSRRRRDGSPAPRATTALAVFCALLWIALRGGWLAI
mgnify:CR=1 FL=1